MAFLKVQKLKMDANGQIISGSASIMDTVYAPEAKGHSRHKTRENLGKVLYLAPDRKSGVFLSENGLVSYDVRTDEIARVYPDDPRVAAYPEIPRAQPHAVFGDVYLFIEYLRGHGWLALFRQVFANDEQHERFLAHLAHGFLCDGSHVRCDIQIGQSALSHALSRVQACSLRRDSACFDLMGMASIKKACFQAYAAWTRQKEPLFGRACCVDSSPLPNDMKDNPLNALRCEARSGCEMETRLGLVLDEITHMPAWFQLFPGNEVDSTKFFDAVEDVRASLGIDVISVVVDAGYVNKDVVRAYGGSDTRTMLARMPNRRGYPYEELCTANKDRLFSFDHDFLRNGKACFGNQEPVTLFDVNMYAYVYLDKAKALRESSRYRMNHENEFTRMSPDERAWCCVRPGFFILVSNRNASPARILSDYIDRVSIEAVFKTGKEFLSLLPLGKWTFPRVCGKILQDVIETTVRAEMHGMLPSSERNLMDWFHMASSLGCVADGDVLQVETPNKQAREAFEHFGVTAPARVDLEEWRKKLLIQRT